MIRLNIVVEGSCEEAFINRLMVPYFSKHNIFIAARKILTGWDPSGKPSKGGLLKYSKFKRDVIRWVNSDRHNPECWYSSMIDLYKFPVGDDSPYTDEISNIKDSYLRVEALEKAIFENIGLKRFIPYVQLHEFETFLLVDPDQIQAMYPDRASKVKALKKEISGLHPVELINETDHGAPSKRIIKHLPEYKDQKAQVGPLVAEEIGIEKLRKHCSHFDQWLQKIEALVK